MSSPIDMNDEPLDDDLRGLLEFEKAAPGLTASHHARLLASVTHAITSGGLPPGGGEGGGNHGGSRGGSSGTGGAASAARATTASAGIAKAIALLAIGATAGALGMRATSSERPVSELAANAPAGTPTQDAPVLMARSTSEIAPTASAAGSARPFAPSSGASAAPSARIPGATTGAASSSASASAPAVEPAASAAPATAGDAGTMRTPSSALAEERTLVERARAAIARRDGISALEALRVHAQKFPAGQLGEERDALTVQALALAGHDADARRKAREFATRYPSSVFRAVVDAAVQ